MLERQNCQLLDVNCPCALYVWADSSRKSVMLLLLLRLRAQINLNTSNSLEVSMNCPLISSCCINTVCCKAFRCKSVAVTLTHGLTLWPASSTAPFPASDSYRGQPARLSTIPATNQPANQLTSQPAIKPSNQPLSKTMHSCSHPAPAPTSPTLIHPSRSLAVLNLSAPQSVVTTSLVVC